MPDRKAARIIPIIAQGQAGVGRVEHSAHLAYLLVVVLVIDQNGVAFFKGESQTPVAIHRY